MVFGLSPTSSASSRDSRPTDEVSTVKAGIGGGRSSRRDRKKKDRSKHDYREPSSSFSSSRRESFSERAPEVFSPSSSITEFDEGYIQKLITEGLWNEQNEVVEDVLNQISNLMFTQDEDLKTKRRDAVYRAGGHLAIVQAMKRNPRAKGIQTQGCRALANATWEESDFMNAITAVGGVDVILCAMIQFSTDEVVQICGSCAMRNLTSLKRIARMFGERDALSVILHAMKCFPMNANIQECGCWSISHLCLEKDNVKYFKRVKCFALVGTAADNHSKKVDVLVAARTATERLWELLL